ncbi:ATP-dependent DNA helicase RecQ-like [Clytia hemisphaerica]|uniref:ATP-dependent DNA helicase RecQ-like n=1 Tax=Clytia hemisphaerica TaxID=252671 RepID=UPI0034D7858E
MYSKKFMCLTATANKKTTRKIIQLLHLRNHKITRLSPEKPNVKISVKKLKQGTDLRYRGKAVGMFHSHTPQELKEIVMKEFSKNNGKCFIVVATSALGMGVNIRNIRHVIHVGLPSDVEAYIQELGRAGRDGDQSSAFLFYRPCDIAHNADEELVRIIKNKEEKCRRAALLKCFNEVPDNDFDNEKHKCCDECENMCNCDECAVPKEEITPPAKIEKC